MKKIFIAFAALATIAACNKAEVIETPEGEAIAFANVFIDNATKAGEATDPSFNGPNKLTKFQVWGTANNVAIFAGEDVTGKVEENSIWTCTKKQYWVEGVNYDFAAVVNGTVTSLSNGLPATISYTANGTSDLIYAESMDVVGKAAGSNVPIEFTFAHLLAKAKFTVETNTDVEGYSYEVTNIKITNAYASGTYDIAEEKWNGVAGSGQAFSTITVSSTDKNQECEQEKLLIPLETVTVSYDVALKYGSEVIWSQTDNTVTPTGLKLEAAKSYNFKLTLNVGEEIKFSVETDPTWTAWPSEPSEPELAL